MSLSTTVRLQRPRPVAFAIALVLAWLLLALVAFALRRGPIEDDLAARATAAVRSTGGVHAQVHVEGREAVVTGRFPSAAAAEQARASAAVAGTTSARLGDDVVIATEPARPLVLAVAGRGLSITATVPDRASRAALLAAVADASGGSVTGEVRVDPAVAEPPVEVVAAVAAALRGFPGSHSVTVSGTTVAVAGSAPDEATRRRLGAQVLAAAGTTVPDATLDNRLVVPREKPAAAAAKSTSDAGALAALRAALDARNVTFPVGAATLSPPARLWLDRVAAALRAGRVVVLVGGHADASGSATLNQALSLDRAQVIADYLTDRGVRPDLIRVAGFGSRWPVADNATPRGRAANRRVEIVPWPDS
ncbi:flagellar motor protein MotB [Frankia sp. CcI156]|uniref:OmpA/MotB n=1 Tax=Frankia casuarinae (strain DSM 45818 / CECT 9043 / HFP020203 / CcI3) TaxID=106370 RepID=Q2JBQ3_FRACC|nr:MULTISPECIES: OmpA family protein [Frankia]KEZ34556.1 outer membrane protein/peptidoglycan-associated (lipo)protein [Frankia sp. CeD]ABD11289.1 OmpA/MotB [Frankia casuarinae]ETA00280.1 outer membrane protein/peptidoglycan-associated (lipo)protein [Frankia sp. CcI6]EYT90126.1 outer membrane protein/peptidoglycan-associated (lipo)protein [Frankia casuarinae]KDA41046.1 outer membrane protein/peptidoglycan-associated (lipo)protein [Frankia sp. BMG5.23]